MRDETTDQDANYEWAKAELQKAQVEMKGLEAREATTSAHLAGYRSLARQLGEDAIVQDDLTSSEKAAQENYLLYVKKREEARMGDALDEGGIVNVAIAEQPVVPALPVWPAGVVVLVGFVAALSSGTGAAFAADYLDPALRTPEEVFSVFGNPGLGFDPGRNRAGGYPPEGDEMSANADVLRSSELIGFTGAGTRFRRLSFLRETNELESARTLHASRFGDWCGGSFLRAEVARETGRLQRGGTDTQMWRVFAIRWDRRWRWRRVPILPSWAANREQNAMVREMVRAHSSACGEWS